MAVSAVRNVERSRRAGRSASIVRLSSCSGLIALGLMVGGCGAGSTVRSGAPATTASVEPSISGDDATALCDLVAAHADTPEAYVGSPEHLADMSQLAAVAPAAVRAQVETVQAYLNSGAVDATKPDTKLISNWPAAVQSAAAELSRYSASTCGVRTPG
jgi:hypothetical protein